MTIPSNISTEQLLSIYRTMFKIRAFELRLAQEFKAGKLPGPVHLYIGQEAVAAGVCAHLSDRDWITSTHRGHGHFLAKNGTPDSFFKEIYGRGAGICGGKGGSIVRAGYQVTVHDLQQDRARDVLVLGGQWANSPRLAAAASDVLFTSLPGPEQIEMVLTGEDGAIRTLAPGSIWVDLSTSDLTLTKKTGRCTRCASRPSFGRTGNWRGGQRSSGQIDFIRRWRT